MAKKNLTIFDRFKISSEEYQNLDKCYGALCWKAAWQLLKKNSKNNHTDDFDDIDQDLRMAMIQAGSYYKRQVYIERCFEKAKAYSTDIFMCSLITELENLWVNRRRHGASRQKFGPHQEQLLENIVKKVVPKKERPTRDEPLVVDHKFPQYCKQIIWNKQKTMGKKITREKSIRTGLTSLSEFGHLDGDDNS